MRNVITVIVLIILLSSSIGLYQVFKYKPDYSYVVTKEPVQENIVYEIENFEKDDFVIIPLKNYEIEARILSKKKYTIGEDSDFATYVTTIGLYNDKNELLAIGKTAKPIRNDKELAMTFVVRFDTNWYLL